MKLTNTIAFALLASVAFAIANAQDYPNKPVRMVVPFAPGGGTDIVARRIAQKLSEGLGQQFVVDNRGGAGGFWVRTCSARTPDATDHLGRAGTRQSSLYKLSFDGGRHFADGCGMSAEHARRLSGGAGQKTQAVIRLPRQARKLNYGSTGVGGFTHLATELFKMMTQTDMVHVPYKGTGPAMADLLGGQVQLLMGGIASELPFVRSGRLKGLGVTTPKRLPGVPDIPAIAETVRLRGRCCGTDSWDREAAARI